MNETESSTQGRGVAAIKGLGLFMGLAIVLPNVWTLVTIARTRSLRTTGNVYVTSLAVTDMLIGFVLATYDAFVLLGFAAMVTEKIACVTFIFATFLSCLASVIASALIAVDRYVYVSSPFFYQRVVTKRRVIWSMLPMWGLATCLAAVHSIFKYADDNVVCSQNIATRADVYFVAPVYFICSFVAGTMYALISRIALRQLIKTVTLPPAPASPSTTRGQEQLRGRLRAVKMFVVVFGVFFCCWTPYVVVHLLLRLTSVSVPRVVYSVVLAPLLLNSILNVPLYLFLNADFRYAFLRVCRSDQVRSTHDSSQDYPSTAALRTISGNFDSS